LPAPPHCRSGLGARPSENRRAEDSVRELAARLAAQAETKRLYASFCESQTTHVAQGRQVLRKLLGDTRVTMTPPADGTCELSGPADDGKALERTFKVFDVPGAIRTDNGVRVSSWTHPRDPCKRRPSSSKATPFERYTWCATRTSSGTSRRGGTAPERT
jgi:hypothetical protein